MVLANANELMDIGFIIKHVFVKLPCDCETTRVTVSGTLQHTLSITSFMK